jgi:WD40 repeat protein
MHPNGRVAQQGKDFAIRILDMTSGKEPLMLVGHTKQVTRLNFSPDGRRLASASGDGTIRLWDVATGNCMDTWKAKYEPVMSVMFSPDGKQLVSAGWYSPMRIWNVETGDEVLSFGEGISTIAWYQAVFSPDGKSIAACSGDRPALVLFNADDGKQIRRFDVTNKEFRFTSVAFSQDGKRLVTTSLFDGDTTLPKIRVWDVESGNELRNYPGGFGAAFASTDGRLVVGGGAGDCDLVVWDVDTGMETGRYPGHFSTVLSLAVTSDFKFALSGGADNTARLWRLSDLHTK